MPTGPYSCGIDAYEVQLPNRDPRPSLLIPSFFFFFLPMATPLPQSTRNSKEFTRFRKITFKLSGGLGRSRVQRVFELSPTVYSLLNFHWKKSSFFVSSVSHWILSKSAPTCLNRTNPINRINRINRKPVCWTVSTIVGTRHES